MHNEEQYKRKVVTNREQENRGSINKWGSIIIGQACGLKIQEPNFTLPGLFYPTVLIWKFSSTGQSVTELRWGEGGETCRECQLISESSQHLHGCRSAHLSFLLLKKVSAFGVILSMFQCARKWKHGPLLQSAWNLAGLILSFNFVFYFLFFLLFSRSYPRSF